MRRGGVQLALEAGRPRRPGSAPTRRTAAIAVCLGDLVRGKPLDEYDTLKDAIAGMRDWTGGGPLDYFRIEYYEDGEWRLTVPEDDVQRLLEEWR